MEKRPLDNIALGPDATADDVLDEGLLETFPASDPIAVGSAYRRRKLRDRGTQIAGSRRKGDATWPFP
jgi:hypothetical protein